MLDRKDLRHYQQCAVEFIKQHENCALFIDMGLGKTVSTLTAFSDLLNDFTVRRMLVVAPLRVARKVWQDEVAEWAHLHHLSVSPIVGSAKERLAAMRKPADIHTINRENCQWLEAQFIQDNKQIMRWPWDMVVLDESSSFKSRSSERWKSMRRLRRLFPRCVELTGTPSPNGYGDLWSQFYLLDRGKRLGATEKAYEDRWFERKGYGEFAPLVLKEGAAQEIKAAVSDIVLSLREEDYLELPPVMKLFHRVQLPPQALHTYRKLQREFIAEFAGKRLTAVNSGVLDGKLLQLANGAVYTDKQHNWMEFHTEKLAALEELIEEIPGKILIAYYFVHDLERIQKVLAKRKDRRWAVLVKDSDFSKWASGEFDVGVLHPASAGHGLNDVYKAGAEDLIHFGCTASLELYAQVNARIAGGHRRAGKNIKIHHIVAEETRDIDYVSILERKDLSQDDLTRSLAARV